MAEGELVLKPKDTESAAGDEVPLAPCPTDEAPGFDDVNAAAGKLGALDPFGEPPQSKAAAGNQCKYRLSKSFIRGIISLRREPLPTTEYMESLAPLFPPEWLEEQKRLHEEEVEICRKVEDDFAEFRRRVIEGVKEKGYFEVDEDYVARMVASGDYFTVSDEDDTRLVPFATPEERKLAEAEGCLLYVPDEDDYLVSDGDDDDEDVVGVDGAILGQQTAHESN